MVVAGIVWAALALALAPAPAAPSAPGSTDVAAAKRLYTIGEQHMAAGRATDAVPLWRKVIAALPETAEYDALRHKLVLRLVYGLLVAHEQSGRRAYLLEASATIARYLRWHEAKFGTGEPAKAARGDLYRQLNEVEARLDVAEPDLDPEAVETRASEDDDSAASTAAADGDDSGSVREVVVPTRRRERPSVDDPEIMARLKSPASTPEAGLVLTAPGVQPLSPARGFVRLAGVARPSRALAGARARRAARALARTVLTSARPRLKRCYESAFARTPTEVVATEVELTIDRDGRVTRAAVRGPDVVDDEGTACVREGLMRARAETRDLRRPLRVRMPVVFFWEDAEVIDEANGCTGSAWHVANCRKKRELNHGAEGGLPPIDAPVRGN